MRFLPLVALALLAAEPAPEKVADWVRQLDDDKFAVREEASRQLLQAGKAAVGPLTAAALGKSLEVSERSFLVLKELAGSADRATAEAARAALQKLAGADHPIAVKARAVFREDLLKVVAALEKAGARLTINGDQVTRAYLDNVQDLKAALPLLKNFPELQEVSLSTQAMDDEGLALLPALPKLDHLNLFQSRIGDDGLKQLKKFPALKSVPMGQTRVTDAGLVHLKDLAQLEYLGLRGNTVTDAGLVHLKGLVNLTGLYLGETKVSDAGLVHLKDMTRMNYLRLHNVNVSDAGLEHLKAMTKLQRLDLWNTKATAEGVQKLRDAVPGLEVLTKDE